SDAALLAGHPADLQVEVVDLRHPTGAVDGYFRLDRAPLATRRHVDERAVAAFFDSLHMSLKVDLHSQIAGCVHQASHQVGIEALERPLPAVDDLHLRAGAGGDVRELEGNVATADEHDPSGQTLELEDLGARGQVPFARDVQRRMPRPARDHHVPSTERLVADPQAGPINETRPPVQYPDTRLRQTVLVLLGHR